jgi:hypothetical protein
MENFLILRKSGILDYVLLECLNYDKEINIFENIGRQFFKIIFILYLTYFEFGKKKKNQLKGLVKKIDYCQLIELLFIHITLLLDRKQKEFFYICDTLDTFSFISLFYIITKDLKT